jgi:hypothetical protein
MRNFLKISPNSIVVGSLTSDPVSAAKTFSIGNILSDEVTDLAVKSEVVDTATGADSIGNGERAIYYKINSNYFVLNARLHNGPTIPTSVDTALVNWTAVSNTHAIFNPTTRVPTVNRAGFIDLVFSASFQNNGNGVRSCHAYKNNTEFVGVNDVTPSSGSSVSTKAIVLAYPVK